MTIDGMTLIVVDASGRLAELHGRAEPTESEAQNPPIDLGRAVRCRRTRDRELPPGDTGPRADVFRRRAARVGRPPARSAGPHRPRRGSVRSGRPVSFGITGPWTRSRREIVPPPSLFNRVIGGIATIMMPALMILAAVLGALERQSRTRRSPRRLPHRRFRVRAQPARVDARHVARRDPRRSKFSASSRRLAARSSTPACVADLPRARTLHPPLRS